MENRLEMVLGGPTCKCCQKVTDEIEKEQIKQVEKIALLFKKANAGQSKNINNKPSLRIF